MSERTNTGAGAAVLAAAALLTLLFVAAVLLDVAPWLRGPAPYPPEWQWEQRSPLAAPTISAWIVAGLAVAALAASALPVAARRARLAARALVALAFVLGACFPLALLEREPAGALRTLLARTTSFSITSYHTAAVSDEAREPLEFVRRHAELLPQLASTAKHAATHPPGPVLLFRAAVGVCERSPALADALLRAASVPDRDFAPPLTRPARAGALLGALALDLLAALAAWPLAALGRGLGLAPLGAARVALLWALLPGPALIAPRFDAALALPVVACAALLLGARHRQGRALAWRVVAAGVSAGAALWLSYGAAVFLVIGGVAVAAAVAAERRPKTHARTAAMLAGAAAIAACSSFGVQWLLGGQPVTAMRTALAIHRLAYTAPRSYALWLLFDPVDFAALLGAAIAALALTRAAAAAVGLARGRRLSPADAFALAVLAAIAALVLAGVARGEVGRIWIPLMPLALLTAFREDDAERPAVATLAAALVGTSTLAVAAAWLL